MKHATQQNKMSHTRLVYHIVFRTKDSFPFITERWETDLYKYISGIVKAKGGKVIAINGMPDHIHLLIVLPACDLPAFIRDLKANSSKWAKDHSPKFSWQRRYGAFTVSESVTPGVRDYIRDQKEHHKKRTFEEEYVSLLKKHHVEYNSDHIWE